MKKYLLVEVEPLEDGRYVAVCPDLQGCHAEAETASEALGYIEDVARILLDLQREEGLPLDPIFEGIELGAVIRAELSESSSRG